MILLLLLQIKYLLIFGVKAYLVVLFKLLIIL